MSMTRERRQVLSNVHQGKTQRILCVCTVGILRSATLASYLTSPPFNFNTRAAGTNPLALIPVTDVLIEWADYIYCMEYDHVWGVQDIIEKEEIEAPPRIECLDIPDDYDYGSTELIGVFDHIFKNGGKL